MTKEVIISIKGLQFESQESEAMEVISIGEYFYKNGKHYVLYDEIVEGEDGQNEVVKSTLKFSDHQVEILKRGLFQVHMVFDKGQKNLTYYNTPMGQILIGLDTSRITIREGEELITIVMEYSLDINYGFVADCDIDIRIASK